MGAVGVAPGTTTITLPDGTTLALEDWIDDRMFGMVQLTDGSSQVVEAFSQGRSGQIPGGQRTLNRTDTNIPRQGDNGLPKDWEFLVYGIGIKWVRAARPATGQVLPQVPFADANEGGPAGAFSDPVSLRTAFDIDRITFIQYSYNGKQYSQGVMQDYPQGHGFNVATTLSSTELAQNGVPSPRDRNAFVLPIDERENLGYTCTFQPEANYHIAQPASDDGATLTAVDTKVYKYGLIKRTVV